MKKTPYPYQQKVIDDAITLIKQGFQRIVLNVITGGGKTIIGAELAARTVEKGNKFVALFYQEKHMQQFENELTGWGLKFQRVTTNRVYYNHTGIITGMVKTFENRIKRPSNLQTLVKETSVFLYDEAHRQDFNGVIDVVDERAPESISFGLTATPQRYGKQRQLYKNWDRLVIGPTEDFLTANGNLSPYRYKTLSVSELEDLKTDSSGEFKEKEVFEKMDKPILYAGVVNEVKKEGVEKSNLIFCVNIEHAIKLCQDFEQNDIIAKFISSKPAPPKQGKKSDIEHAIYMQKYNFKVEGIEKYSGNNDVITDDWRGGKFHQLVNVNMYTAGFDFPQLQIVTIFRSTAILSLWEQIKGRVMRNYEGKTGLVLDFGNHLQRFKVAPNSNIEWSLVHHVGAQAGKGVQADKICPKCMCIIPITQAVCEFCGAVDKKALDKKAAAGKKLTEIELQEVDFERLEHLKQKSTFPPEIYGKIKTLVSQTKEKKINPYLGASKAFRIGSWECVELFSNLSNQNCNFVSEFKTKFFQK